MEKVLVDPHFRRMAEVFSPQDRRRLEAMADVVWGRDEPIPMEALEAEKADIVAVVAASWRYGDVAKFPRLRAVLEVSGRFPDADALDYAACFARNIRVLSCAPAFAPLVAEMALGLALAGARGLAKDDAAMRAGTDKWWTPESHAGTFSLFEQTVGFIGFGSIARTLKTLLAPFRCAIQVYDPWLTDAFLRTQGVVPMPLETLLETSNIVFVLAAPSDSNRAMLNRERLARMSPESLLVLVSRAHVVDFDALTELLTAGKMNAAIDVFPAEPPPLDDPIRAAPNCILSPHKAGSAGTGYSFIGSMVLNDLEAILAGLPPQQMQMAQPELIRARGDCRK